MWCILYFNRGLIAFNVGYHPFDMFEMSATEGDPGYFNSVHAIENNEQNTLTIDWVTFSICPI